MRRKEGIKQHETDGRERAERWQGFISMTLFATVASSLLGGWLGIWLSPSPFLAPVGAAVGAIMGGCGGFAAWVLIAIRFGWIPKDGG